MTRLSADVRARVGATCGRAQGGPFCEVCGGPRSRFSVSKCRACYCATDPGRRSAVIGLGTNGDITIQIFLTLKGQLAQALDDAAAERNRPPVDVLADIIETVLGDNLIGAVLDDGA
jgi:hypothetical protein